MDLQELNRRCVQLFYHPDVQLHCWHPRLFWAIEPRENPAPEDLTRAKVDLMELEVLFAEAAHQPSLCADELERRDPGRVSLIRRMLRRGEMPLLKRPH